MSSVFIVVSLVSVRYISRSPSAPCVSYRCVHKYPVSILHIVIPADSFSEYWVVDMSCSSFLGISCITAVDFGEGIWDFLLHTTVRVVLMNENSVNVRMDC